MKSILFTGVLSIFLLISCSQNSESSIITNWVPKEGKGKITEKKFDLSFDEISVSNSISAEIYKSEKEEVIVTAPENLLNDILVENVGKKLIVKMKPGIHISTKKIRVKIFAKDFTDLEATSSSAVDIKDKFTQEKTSVKVKSSASVKGDLEANDLNIDAASSSSFTGNIWAVQLRVNANSSSKVELTGKTKEAVFDVSSSSTVSAQNVVAQIADVKASSSSSASLSVSDELNASANSSGSIAIKKAGNLVVQKKNENSGGSISIE